MKKIYEICAFIYRYFEIYFRYFISIFFRIFPINSNKIVVCSYFGGDYNDNPKYIVEKILEADKNNKYEIVWILKKSLINNNAVPKSVKIVKYGSLAHLFELSTAKVWIDNARQVIFPLKRKNQYYFQVWHGALPIKTVEFDTKETLTKIYVKKALIDSKNADYFLSGSKWASELYRNSFCFHGSIIEKGIPRDDIFFDKTTHNNIIKKVYSHFNISNDYKILLFAPTFRNDKSTDIYLWNYEKIIKVFEKKYKKKFILLIRLHPNIIDKISEFDCFNERIKNATSYPDMQELVIAGDILITDYSSVMFDFGMLEKKCMLYAPDIDNYLKERKFYFDIKKLPFPLAENEMELENNINKFNDSKYRKELRKFYENIGLCETGNSAQIVANKIMEICDNHEKK